jgi:hypothetical protein
LEVIVATYKGSIPKRDIVIWFGYTYAKHVRKTVMANVIYVLPPLPVTSAALFAAVHAEAIPNGTLPSTMRTS